MADQNLKRQIQNRAVAIMSRTMKIGTKVDDINFFKEVYDKAVEEVEGPVRLKKKAAKELKGEFSWYDDNTTGYFTNLNKPRELKGQELYKFLGIENDKQQIEKLEQRLENGKRSEAKKRRSEG